MYTLAVLDKNGFWEFTECESVYEIERVLSEGENQDRPFRVFEEVDLDLIIKDEED